MKPGKIRNFCIIAHIDHGKSTLADRFLELTKTIEAKELKEQTLDTMDLERERGITIKLQPVRMRWKGYVFNLIDTPGHVDFSYEVSRSLQACEGAILLVDGTQGIQAQTLTNYNLARDLGLKIIPVVNKIDLAAAQTEKVKKDLAELLKIPLSQILEASAKTGAGVEKIIDRIITFIPKPKGDQKKPLRALIFDSFYDPYQAVIAIVRVVDGSINKGEKIKIIGSGALVEVIELGHFKPKRVKQPSLTAGEIGYIATGLKDVNFCQVGDTISKSKVEALPGYKKIKPMVFSQIFCVDSNDYHKLKDGLSKLKLNDASLIYEPVSSEALGFGFRCGFLGLLHMDIIRQRIEREFDLNIILTAPTVNYRIELQDGSKIILTSPAQFPEPYTIKKIEEPYVEVEIITPTKYLGPIMDLLQKRRGQYKKQEYLTQNQVLLTYQIPLAKIILDFYDQLKSVSSGFASLNYTILGFKKAEIIKLDILVAQEKVDALSVLVYPDEAHSIGRSLVVKLKKIIHRQMFPVPLQAAIGGKIIARETVRAFRKNVTAKLYGGDRTRKDKLLEKQKRGKKRMKKIGQVEMPPEAFLAILAREK